MYGTLGYVYGRFVSEHETDTAHEQDDKEESCDDHPDEYRAHVVKQTPHNLMKLTNSTDEFIVSFLPKIFGRNQDFPKGSVWGEVTFFFKVPGEKGFWEGI